MVDAQIENHIRILLDELPDDQGAVIKNANLSGYEFLKKFQNAQELALIQLWVE